MMTTLLRTHCEHNTDHNLPTSSTLHGDQLVRWHDNDHGNLDRQAHDHNDDLRVEILEVKVEALDTRLSGVIETHQLWDGS